MPEKQRIIGIGQFVVSSRRDERLTTYSLGSCIGLTLHDPVRRVGGLLHAQMPLSTASGTNGGDRPGRYVDTGVAAMLAALFDLGAARRNLIACAAGGASLLDENGFFNIGQRNYVVLRKVLWKNGILLAAEDVHGNVSRSMHLEMATGRTTITRQGASFRLYP